MMHRPVHASHVGLPETGRLGSRGLAVLLLLTPGPLAAQSVSPRFVYAPELDMVRLDEKGRLHPIEVDAQTGLVPVPRKNGERSNGGVAPWISARIVDPATEALFQHHVRDRSILWPTAYDERIRDDLGFSTRLDKKRKALVLSRVHHLRHLESRFEVSNVIGLVQDKECYLGQMEVRWGERGRWVHCKRTQQRAGPLLENGFPSFVSSELVQTASTDGSDVAKMVRIILVFPMSRRTPARVRVHLVGDLRRQSGGRSQTRKIHVISEFTVGGGIKLWTSVGETYPYLSWEDAVTYKHEHAWQNTGSGRPTGSHEWERPFQPFSPRDHGVRPIPMVALLALPPKWKAGGYDGGALPGKRIAIEAGKWTLSAKDFVVSGGVWQFDKRGELIMSSPLGTVPAKKVLAWFKAQFAAAKSDPAELANLRDCLAVVVNWASDMPQLPGAGPGKSPPSVRTFLSAK